MYVSLIALANSAHAEAEGNGAAGVIKAFGDIIGKFAPNQNDRENTGNTGMQGGLMNLGGFAQQGLMMQNGVQPVNFQSFSSMNQGTDFAGQMGNYNDSAGGFSAGDLAVPQQMPGTPMIVDGQSVIDPATGQPVLVPQPGTMNPGAPMIGANGQPILNPVTGQPVLVPQAGSLVPHAPLNAQTSALIPQQNAMGGILAGPIDESVLMDAHLNPQLYAQIMAEAQKDPQLTDALARVKEELNEEDAKLVRATLLKPILMRMNLSQVQKAQMLQAQQMQQQQAMTQANAAARAAEQQRIQTIEAEISRLEQENTQIIANLKRQGVSQEEINAIISRSRQDGARVAGNTGALAVVFPETNAPQASALPALPDEPEPQVSALPAFPGIPEPQASGLPAFPGTVAPQASALPAFPGTPEPQETTSGLPQMPF